MHQPPLIGKNIQAKRKERRMSLEALSKRCGVSKSMLSQIEQDKTNPTIITAWKIAKTLSMSIEELMENKDGALIEVIKNEDAPTMSTNDNKGYLKVNSPMDTIEETELYTVHLEPKGINASEAHAPGAVEFLYIIEGEVKVTAGDHAAVLQPGDTARYNADIAHSAENIGDKEAKMFLVVNIPMK
ncbi:MAG: helix-turn-helix transcriptional regulator [Firmicutes bacterium]|nr:helix-turn-helix transcriptional regulator [Bacillota bacterium]